MCTTNEHIKILIIQGPSGSGKNSMIDIFGDIYNYEIVRFKDEKSAWCPDLFEANRIEDEGFNKWYPDDLEKLCYFIRMITKSACNRVGQSGESKTSSFSAPKTTSFSSFASKGSSFGKKKEA
jgi:hypothetical protein